MLQGGKPRGTRRGGRFNFEVSHQAFGWAHVIRLKSVNDSAFVGNVIGSVVGYFGVIDRSLVMWRSDRFVKAEVEAP